jgi:hypothetical protein
MLEFSAWAEPLVERKAAFTPARAGEEQARRRQAVPVTI